MKKLTLKEMYMREEKFSTPYEELEKYTRRNINSYEDAKHLIKQYEMFDDVMEHVAMEVADKQSPEEKRYRKNENVDVFFKHLISKSKNALKQGVKDYDDLPTLEEYISIVKEMYDEFKTRKKDDELVRKAMDDYVSGMNPEKQIDRKIQNRKRFHKAMTSGEYGKLD